MPQYQDQPPGMVICRDTRASTLVTAIAKILNPEKTQSMLYKEKALEDVFRRMYYSPTNTAFGYGNHWHVIAIALLLITKSWPLLVESKQGCFIWEVRDIEITLRNPTLGQISLSHSFHITSTHFLKTLYAAGSVSQSFYITSTHFPKTLCAAGSFTPFFSSTCKNYWFPQSAMTML